MKKTISLKYDYTLDVGKNGFRRLLLLNELINSDSIDFINSAVELKNKHVLEVGCGAGIMASKIASQCLPHGSVLATDISNEQLEIAAEIAKKSNTQNIRFKQIAAINIDQLKTQFDVIYFRLVLGHLPNVLEVLQKVITLMHTDSILICEEIESVETMFCDPPESVFNWWRNALDCQIKANKGDFTVGTKLSDYFKQINLSITNSKSIQPIIASSKLKQQLWLGIIEITAILISSGFSTQPEINDMIIELQKLANSPLTKVGFFSLRQMATKIPSHSIPVSEISHEKPQIKSKL